MCRCAPYAAPFDCACKVEWLYQISRFLKVSVSVMSFVRPADAHLRLKARRIVALQKASKGSAAKESFQKLKEPDNEIARMCAFITVSSSVSNCKTAHQAGPGRPADRVRTGKRGQRGKRVESTRKRKVHKETFSK